VAPVSGWRQRLLAAFVMTGSTRTGSAMTKGSERAVLAGWPALSPAAIRDGLFRGAPAPASDQSGPPFLFQ